MKNTPLYLYGKHAALAALANPMRKIKRVMVTKNTLQELRPSPKPSPYKGEGGDPAQRRGGAGEGAIARAQIVDPQKIEALLPKDAVHQGIVAECEPLPQPSLHEWLQDYLPTLSSPLPNPPPSGERELPLSRFSGGGTGRGIILLDQVSDPHNVGAILRSAAAFGIGAVVTLERGAAQESGTLAKSASGALEIVPLISVSNLAQAIELLKKDGYWVYGLDGEAKQTIGQVKFDTKTALILGAEGRGLRRLTAERCDMLVKIPMSGQMESLNVSNAAAVAMYEMMSSRKS